MFILSADKSKLSVLQRGIITSGSVNSIDVKFQFDSDWDNMDRVAVFKVGTVKTSVVLEHHNRCKLPWECVRENDIGKTVYAGVCGMVGTNVVLPTIWVSLGEIREGTQIGDITIPPTPSVSEQILADAIEARDAAEEAAKKAEDAVEKIETIAKDVQNSAEMVENSIKDAEELVKKIEDAEETIEKIEEVVSGIDEAVAKAEEAANRAEVSALKAELSAVKAEDAADRAENASVNFATDEQIMGLLDD